MIGMIIDLIIVTPFVVFITVYRWFSLKCMYCVNSGNLTRVAIE